MSDRPPPELPPEIWDMIAQLLPNIDLGRLNVASPEMQWLTQYQLNRRAQAHQLLAQRNNVPQAVMQMMMFGPQAPANPARIQALTFLLGLVEGALGLGPRYTQGSDWTLILEWINSLARGLTWQPGTAPPDICGRAAQVTARAVQMWNLELRLVYVVPPG